MKKILISIIAALCAVVTNSSFVTMNKKFSTHYYWAVSPGAGNLLELINSNLTTYYGTIPPSNSPCAYPGIFNCVVGFSRNQVTKTASGTKLITFNGLLPQSPSAIAYKRLIP